MRRVGAPAAVLLAVAALAGCSATATPVATHEATEQQQSAAPSTGPAVSDATVTPVVERPGASAPATTTLAAADGTTVVVPVESVSQPVVREPTAHGPEAPTASQIQPLPAPSTAPTSSPKPTQTQTQVPAPAPAPSQTQTPEPEPTPIVVPAPTPTKTLAPTTWREGFDVTIYITVVTDGSRTQYRKSGYESTCSVIRTYGEGPAVTYTGRVVTASMSDGYVPYGTVDPVLTWSGTRVMATATITAPLGTALDTFGVVHARATCEFTR